MENQDLERDCMRYKVLCELLKIELSFALGKTEYVHVLRRLEKTADKEVELLLPDNKN